MNLVSRLEPVDRRLKKYLPTRRDWLGFAPPEERGVLVVHFVRNVLRSRLGGDEFDLADQIRAPRFIDPLAELTLHAFELLSPGLAIGCDFKIPSLATNGPHMCRERLTDNCGPGAGKPRESAFWPIHPTNNTPQKLSGFLHRVFRFYHLRLAALPGDAFDFFID